MGRVTLNRDQTKNDLCGSIRFVARVWRDSFIYIYLYICTGTWYVRDMTHIYIYTYVT